MRRSFWILAAMLGLASCAPGNVFVLMPDADGTVGAIEVRNDAGFQRIDRPQQATRVASARSAPEAPTAIGEREIEDTWGPALRVAALAPRTFVLYFLLNSDRLTPDSQAQLAQVNAAVREFPAPEVAVVGHTDRLGRSEFNARLALQRAELIRDALVAAGVAARMIEVTSHGESNPLVPTADEVAEPRNRRVEVSIR